MPRIINGSLDFHNKNCFDWGWQGLLAYGCQSCVVVVHPGNCVQLQTLEGHRNPVSKVRWARENHPHDAKSNSYQLSLASADTSGSVIVWDVSAALQRSAFSDNGKPVLDMHWVPFQDSSKDFILVLHAPYNLILWNADTGTRLWKKTYTDSLAMFCFDPFNSSNVAFLTQSGSVVLIDDFSVNKSPSSNGAQHFRMSNLVSTPNSSGNLSGSSSTGTGLSERASGSSGIVAGVGDSVVTGRSLAVKYLRKPLMQVFQTATGAAERLKSDNSSDTGDECIQISYHVGVRNRLLLTYSKEVLFLDIESLQTVAHVVLEKSNSSLVQVVPCAQRDAVYMVQEGGAVSFRIQKVRSSSPTPVKKSASNALGRGEDAYDSVEAYYETVCNSESLRVTKSYRVYGLAIDPCSERKAAVLMSNGRILLFNVDYQNSMYTSAGLPSRNFWLSDMVRHCSSPDPNYKIANNMKLKFVLSSVCSVLEGTPTVAKAAPMITEDFNKQLIAIGSTDGNVQLVDLRTGDIQKDFSVHSCSITCLEWCGNRHVVTSGFTQTLSASNVVRNELYMTNIQTGLSKLLRPEVDESPIEMIRVSHYCSYLAVAFKDQPLEIWDLNSLRLLRRMSKSCPMIVDLAWSGKHHQAKQVTKASHGFDESRIEVLQKSSTSSQTVYRENLVILDNDNHLYHIVVKGMHVRDGKEVSTQWQTSSPVTAMVWKNDYLAFGDNEGRLQVWDLTGKESRALPSQRGGVKRLDFSNQPQSYLLIALHTDGVSIWDVAKFTCVHQLVAARDLPASVRVVDVDLIGVENWPMLLTSDGSVRIYDKSLTVAVVRIPEFMLNDCFCPALLPPSMSWLLQAILIDPLVQSSLCPAGTIDINVALDNVSVSKHERSLLKNHVAALDENQLDAVIGPNWTIQDRAICVNRIFGDEWGVKFWCALAATVSGLSGEKDKEKEILCEIDEFLLPNPEFRQRQLQRCALFDVRRASYEHLSAHIEQLLLLGQRDKAVQLLLETDNSNTAYYVDSLRACLIAALQSGNEDSHMTIKLVATNMIAAGRVPEGIQLLAMIGKNLEACRYLISCGEWQKAAWLAKVALSDEECAEIIKRWADHLASPQGSMKSMSLLLYLRLQRFEKVLEILISLRQFGTAALLLRILEARGLMVSEDETKHIPAQSIEAIYGEYARELQRAGLTPAALLYCGYAGNRGVLLKKEIEILASEKAERGDEKEVEHEDEGEAAMKQKQKMGTGEKLDIAGDNSNTPLLAT